VNKYYPPKHFQLWFWSCCLRWL